MLKTHGGGVGGVGDAVLRQVADAGVGCRQCGGRVGGQCGAGGRVVEAAGLLGLAEADVFLVVVVGGVGQVWGAVLAALGLGISGTVLEIGLGAVLAKIILLVLVILFIQKRPQGLFAIKGRFVE